MALFSDLVGAAEALLSIKALLLLLSVVAVGSLALLYIYRIYWSPLAGFPGPKIAAATTWYEFYWNVVKDGQFTFHLQELHDRYGPIVRINPWELHIRDPDFFETIYDGHGARKDKFPGHVLWTDTPTAAQATVDHDLHKIRRAAQNPYFSKGQVRAFSPFIQSAADKLLRRLANEYRVPNKPTPLGQAYGCFTGDVMMEYCFAKNHDFLGFSEFRSPFLESVGSLVAGVHIVIQFPWLLKVVKAVPESILPSMVMHVQNFKKDMRNQIQEVIAGANQRDKDASHRTVFKGLLDSDLPPQEKTIDRLQDEGVTMVGAGQETVKAGLGIATFYLLKDPARWQILREELLTVFPDPTEPPGLAELERLPYLTAVIQESVRLSYGLVSRLARVADVPIKYNSHTIPAGTPMSMSHYYVHHDERLFPDSFSFIPERWLNNPRAPVLSSPNGLNETDSGGKLLSRYMVGFQKGARTCLGVHLAWAEMYIMLANVVRRCELELFETEYKDVGFMRDLFVPAAAASTKGLQVMVKDVQGEQMEPVIPYSRVGWRRYGGSPL